MGVVEMYGCGLLYVCVCLWDWFVEGEVDFGGCCVVVV